MNEIVERLEQLLSHRQQQAEFERFVMSALDNLQVSITAQAGQIATLNTKVDGLITTSASVYAQLTALLGSGLTPDQQAQVAAMQAQIEAVAASAISEAAKVDAAVAAETPPSAPAPQPGPAPTESTPPEPAPTDIAASDPVPADAAPADPAAPSDASDI